MIEVSGLYKKYGNHTAVKNVSFSVKKGEIVGFLGPNGAGKSTIMNILTGYLSLTAGEVTVDGFNILTDPEQAKKRIGYLPEIPPLYVDMTVEEYLGFIYDLKKAKFPKAAHIGEIMNVVKIDDVAKRLIKNLSKGYRQRVGIAQALIGNPDVLILDEPTVGLDPKQILEIRNLISRLSVNHTVILSSHILQEIQAVCKRIIIINGGELIADDTPENLSKALSKDKSLTVRTTGDPDDVVKILKSVDGVNTVEILGENEKGTCDYKIEAANGRDVRSAVAERLSERRRPVLDLHTNSLSLEQIFLKLTSGEDIKLINSNSEQNNQKEDEE